MVGRRKEAASSDPGGLARAGRFRSLKVPMSPSPLQLNASGSSAEFCPRYNGATSSILV